MSTTRIFSPQSRLFSPRLLNPSDYLCLSCQRARSLFSTSAQRARQDDQPFRIRLRAALRNTRIQWKPIPVGLGIAFLGAVQFYRVREREKRRRTEEDEALALEEGSNGDGEPQGKPKKRKRIRPSGPWYARTDTLTEWPLLNSSPGKSKSCQRCR